MLAALGAVVGHQEHLPGVQSYLDEAEGMREAPLWFLEQWDLPSDRTERWLQQATLLAFAQTGVWSDAQRRLLVDAADRLGVVGFDRGLLDHGSDVGPEHADLLQPGLLDLHNRYHREVVAAQLADGCAAVFQVATAYTVCAAANRAGVQQINRIKERRADKPATLLVTPDLLASVVDIVDRSRLAEELVPVVSHTASLRILAESALTRIPIRPGVELAGQALHGLVLTQDESGDWLQVLCPSDPSSVAFIGAVNRQGHLLAASSLNHSSRGEPSITGRRRMLEFCADREVSLALLDGPLCRGSFQILKVSEAGAQSLRTGRPLDIPELLTRARDVVPS